MRFQIETSAIMSNVQVVQQEKMKLHQLPTELFLFNIFEYLIGPIEFFSSKVGFGNETESIENVVHLLSCVEGLPLENIKGLNSFCVCANKSLRDRLIHSEVNETYWLHVSNMFELVMNDRRYRDYQSLELGKGDLYPSEVIRMANMQILIEATELGKKIEYTDALSSSNDYRGNRPELEDMVNNDDPIQITREYEKRLKKFIMQPEKYHRVKEKVSITSYELFMFKAIMLCLDMISYFDVETDQLYMDTDTVRFMTARENYDTCLAIDSQWGFTGEALLASFQNPELTDTDPLSLNTIQYLTIDIQEPYCTPRSLLNRVFPNVKYLRVIFSSKQACSYEEELEDANERFMFVELINKKIFPKLVHLSVREISKTSYIFESEILDQLLYLDIVQCESFQNGYKKTSWTCEDGLTSQYPKLLTENNLMHHLILHGNIHHYTLDVSQEVLEEYYNSTKNHFVASLSHSSINSFYDNCYE